MTGHEPDFAFMTDLIGLLIVLLALAYAGFVFWCYRGFSRGVRLQTERDHRSKNEFGESEPQSGFVSVIVPARNEADSVTRCVAALLANNYPKDAFEIVIVDDQSTDGTASRVVAAYPNEVSDGSISIVGTTADARHYPAGKQRALDTGIESARGDIILTTDADCVVGPSWIRAMAGAVAATGSAAAGPIRCRLLPGASLFHRMQALELSGLLGVGAGTMTLEHPTICSSASLGYTRSLYDSWRAEIRDVKPNGAAPGAGSDETIVHDARSISGTGPRFVLEHDAVVESDPNNSITAFLRQRARWASMGGRYPAPRVVAISASIFLLFLLFVVAPLLGVIVPWITAVALKVLADGLLLRATTRFLHPQKRLLRLWPVAEIFHAPYIVLVSIVGALAPIRWKR